MVRSGTAVSYSTQETHKIQKIVLGIMSAEEIVTTSNFPSEIFFLATNRGLRNYHHRDLP